MNLIELSNWGWVVLLCVLMLLVWLLVLFQARQSTHEVQLTTMNVHDSEETTRRSDHTNTHAGEEG